MEVDSVMGLKAIAFQRMVLAGMIQKEDTDEFDRFWCGFERNLETAIRNEVGSRCSEAFAKKEDSLREREEVILRANAAVNFKEAKVLDEKADIVRQKSELEYKQGLTSRKGKVFQVLKRLFRGFRPLLRNYILPIFSLAVSVAVFLIAVYT